MKRIYFAHPIPTYYTIHEERALKSIEEKYPNSEIDNPANHPSKDMSFYLKRVEMAQCVVFMSNTKDYIGKGVFEEVEYAKKLGKEIIYYSFKENLFTTQFGIKKDDECDWENYALVWTKKIEKKPDNN